MYLLLPANTGSSAQTQVPTKVAFVMKHCRAGLQSGTDLWAILLFGVHPLRMTTTSSSTLMTQHEEQGGVEFLIHKKLKGNIEEFHATSNRVASVTIRISKRYKIRIIQVYAPTSVSSQEELEEFYDDLQTEMRHKKTHYNVIMGDFNAKVGK